MNMTPRDGVAADPQQTWCLADDADESVLLYSLAGGSIQLLRPLRGTRYQGLWFDPRSGATHPAGPLSTEIRKPSDDPWLLLLVRQF